MAAFQAFSDEIAQLVEGHGQAVVRVEARAHRPATGVVWSADGHVVTSHHAVEREDGIEVGLPDGKTVTARLVGRDPTTDLALLKADASGLFAPAWSDLERLKVGHFILALARPGRTMRAALGIVGTLGGEWRSPAGGRIERYLQVDLGLHPGFSGGMLADASGRIVGLATSGLLRGHALGVPTPTVQRVVSRLLERGQVQRAYLGVGTYPVRLPRALAESTGQSTALLVVSVQPGGPGERSGLLLGDVLLALDGERLEDVGDLIALLDEERVGKGLQLRVVRAGQPVDVQVTAGARP